MYSFSFSFCQTVAQATSTIAASLTVVQAGSQRTATVQHGAAQDEARQSRADKKSAR